VAAIKAKGYFFQFYKRPITAGSFAEALNHTNGDTVGDYNVTAWDFRLYEDKIQCFAVLNNSNIYRFEFSFDASKTSFTTKQFFRSF
jgi:hypothetical protein